MGIKGQRFRLQKGWFIGLMKVEWILCNLCKWTRRSREESGRRRYELGPNWRSKIWTVTTTTSPMTGGHAELRLGGHEDKVSSKNGWRLIWTNPKFNEPKIWSDESFSKEMLRRKYVDSRQKPDLVHPVPYARNEPDKWYLYCSFSYLSHFKLKYRIYFM